MTQTQHELVGAPLTRAQVESVVHAATLAPSVLNLQPWRFAARRDGVLELRLDPARTLPRLDPRHRARTISCGAALLNLRLAIRVAGREPEVQLLPGEADPTLLATVRAVEPAEPTSTDVRLHSAIWHRRTSRVPFSEQPLAPELIIELEAVAATERAVLRVLDTDETVEVTRLVHAADEAQRSDTAIRAEIAQWVHRPADAVDGIPAPALGPAPADPHSLVRDFALGAPVHGRPTAQFERDSMLALLHTDGDEPVDWLRAGQALQRMWLAATAAGVAISLLTQPLELPHLRWLTAPLAEADGRAASVSTRRAGGRSPQVLLRMGHARSVSPPTPRRQVTDVLTFVG